MKRGLKIFLAGFILIAAGFAGYYYFHPERAVTLVFPELDKVEKVHIRLKGDSALINARLKLVNKSLFKLTTDSLIYRVRLDTALLLVGAQRLDISLKPAETDTLNLPLALPVKRLIEEIKRLGHRDSAGIELDLRVVYATIFGAASLPVKRTITIEVPIPPRFEIEKTEYLKRDKKTFYVNAYVRVINKGRLDLDLSEIRYHLTVKDNFTASGKKNEPVHLDPGSEMTVVVPIRLESEHWLKTLFNIVTDNDQVRYSLKINAMIRANKLDEESTSIEVEKSGMMELKK